MHRWLALSIITLALVVFSNPSSVSIVSAADPVDVTVRITRVVELEEMDGLGAGEADFYAQVQIGTHPFEYSSRVDNEADIRPDWRFTRNVDRDLPIPVTIRIFDYDSGFGGGSDWADINPNDSDVELNLQFDGHTGTWTGDVTGHAAEGDGDHGFPAANDGRRARIEFQIFVGTNPDIDGDGIPNSIEIHGVKRMDGSVVLDAAELNPCRKTIIVWTDYMDGAADGHTHRMKPAAVTDVVNAFNAAPVTAVTPCPFGSGYSTADGIDLVYIEGTAITEREVMGFDANYRAAKSANFPPELRPYAHYAIMLHDQAPNETSSGLCCDSDGDYKDFLVSLGSWNSTCVSAGANGVLDTTPAGDDVVDGETLDVGNNLNCDTTATGDDEQFLTVGTGAADARVGTVLQQGGTFMHELGHALGLGHGGNEETNRKSNYLSVMNYNFQSGLPRGAVPAGATSPVRVLDFSRVVLPTLVETALDEGAGHGGTIGEWTRWVDPSGAIRWASPTATGFINWNWDAASAIENPVSVNLNADADAGADQTNLTGWDDWSNLKYRAIDAVTAGGANAWLPTSEQTFEEYIESEIALLNSVPSTVEIRKVLRPSNAPGTFNLQIDGSTVGTGAAVGHNGTTGSIRLDSATPVTISETAAGSTQLYHYVTEIVCQDSDGNILAEGEGTSLALTPQTGLAITCIITNSLPIPEACLTKTYTNFILGTPNAETLTGTGANDIIIGYGGNDTIDGRQGNDCIAGGDGEDKLIGGTGDDIIAGDSGNDTIEGGNDNDLIFGGIGNDTINGGNGNDTIFGEGGNDIINGGNQDDVIHGGADNDTVEGGNGNDLLYGNDGTDSLNGGSGTDRCSAANGGGNNAGESVKLCEQPAPPLPP